MALDGKIAIVTGGSSGVGQEIGRLVAWLASDEATYATATTFTIDRGMMQQRPGL
jgi:NAD(P)-dependent dehydrogenase (short-subunit alcohol dehydrogenase family)